MYLIARFNPYETSLLSEEDGKESIRVGLSSITWFTCNTLLWQGELNMIKGIITN